MRLYQKALLVAAGVVVFQSGAMETGHTLPLMQHHTIASFTPGVCFRDDAWRTTLNVTANVAGGIARIENQASPFELPMPVAYQFNIEAVQESYTVHVTVRWPSGFTSEPLTVTAHRPETGCTPPPTTTPPVTSCVDAIPPREDCGSLTAQPVDTVPPTWIVNPPSSSEPPVPTTVETPTTTTTVALATPPSSTIARRVNLPATGVGADAIVFVGLSLLLLGGALIVTRRRGAA